MASMYSDSVRAFLKPIVPFLDDAAVNEVVINGPTEVWIERHGRIERAAGVHFTEEGLLAACRNVAQYIGRQLSEERPRLDARLPDGSRIHIILAPVALKGTVLAIRKFMREALSVDKLIELRTATPALAKLLEAVMRLRLNVIVAGGTGSGKTSLLNVLASHVNPEERVVTIEDSAELQLQLPGVIGLESRPPDKFGKGEVTLADLLNSALRLRPDRIVVGEARGGECLSLLQAMNTGHAGSMATTHANTPVGTLRRLESLCLMSGVELPLVAIRAQVASAVNVVVGLERFPDGTRKVTYVSEVLPLDDKGEYRVQDLFVYTQTGRDAVTQAVDGTHAPTGVLPTFLSRFRGAGVELTATFFDPLAHGVPQPPIFTAGYGEMTQWAPSIKARLAGEPAPVVAPWSEIKVGASASAKAEPAPPPPPAPPPARPAAPSPPPLRYEAPATPIVSAAAAPSKPPLARPAAPVPVMVKAVQPAMVSEPKIEVAADLLEEDELERTPTLAPAARKAGDQSDLAIPPEDRTDPHIRLP